MTRRRLTVVYLAVVAAVAAWLVAARGSALAALLVDRLGGDATIEGVAPHS